LSFKHIIFDCDGVLIDSEALSMAIDQRLLAESRVFISEADMHRRFVGKTFQAMIADVEQEYGMVLPPGLEARKDALMVEAYQRDLKAIAGVALALAQIDLPKSIGTNGPRARALLALEVTGLKPHFEERLTTFEDVERGKPHPDIYLLAAKRAGVLPSNCVVIEDSLTGVTAAVAAGCYTLGFTGAHLHRSEHGLQLAELGAAQVFHHMADLPKIIKALMRPTKAS
jgi:HAD superfamily hydrolase (TIGR01509 family)